MGLVKSQKMRNDNDLCGFMTPTRCLFLSDKLEMYLLILKKQMQMVKWLNQSQSQSGNS